MLVRVTALPPKSLVPTERFGAGGSEVSGIIVAMRTSTAPPPNPSFERTSKGWPRYARSSLFASRGQPSAAAQVTR